MPTGQKADYSKALIYKISCRDPSITDCYVGSTTNLIMRDGSDIRILKSRRSAFSTYFQKISAAS